MTIRNIQTIVKMTYEYIELISTNNVRIQVFGEHMRIQNFDSREIYVEGNDFTIEIE